MIMDKNIPQTEQLYQKSKPLDHLSMSEGIMLMVNEQKAALEVENHKLYRTCYKSNI